MLKLITGSLDVSEAAFLIALVAGLAIVVTTFIATWQSKQKTVNDFELAKIEKENSQVFALKRDEQMHIQKMEQIRLANAVQMRQVETKQITIDAKDHTAVSPRYDD